jgi:hypothetical protein
VPDRFHAGDEGGRHRALSDQKNAERTLRRRNLDVVFIGQFVSPQKVEML